MSLITRMYRARLGVGLSPEVKKAPAFVFRPGFGVIKLQCCNDSGVHPSVKFDTVNNLTFVGFTGTPATYITPPLLPGFSWSVSMTLYTEDLGMQTTTRVYPAGQTFAIYLGNPGTFIPFVGLWVPQAGASGIFETFSNGNPSVPVLTSNGGNYANIGSYATFVLTRI